MTIIDPIKEARLLAAIKRGETLNAICEREQCSQHPVYRLAAQHGLTIASSSGDITPEMSAKRLYRRCMKRLGNPNDTLRYKVPIEELMLKGIEE